MKLLFKQRLFSWFDSYDIYDEAGETVFTVKGRLSWGHCLEIYDRFGEHVGTVKEEVLTLLPRFAKMNKNGVPVTLVISQLVITSIALIILTNTGGGNNMSFLIALALTVVIYLCAYFMLFIGYIVLVLKHPDLKRTFNIPGGKGVKLVVAIVGLLTSIMAFIVSFLPPDNIQGDSTDMYVELLVVSFLVVLALPFILYAVHDRKSKANTGVTLEPINSQNAPKGHFFLHPRARSPHYIVMNDKKH